jgi:hypothetical protein
MRKKLRKKNDPDKEEIELGKYNFYKEATTTIGNVC